eukprot:CAMPEP_0174708566 /NCGR_PEP_ID=MMETSP1094-20130205/10780_1 /TAXON_ID=156173 /ORGANISM="Chrysochromulina brevifilum, Strain UTEX LB 985" /LENGTH=87 /DNA_ID=CAMNT_0015907139 /DNA_START=134 /DNA_END=397 /DNA_ORIENTATION=+
MQTPFGSEGLDMPGLSYVCAAAELSLRMVHRGRQERYQLFGVLNAPLDKQHLLSGVASHASSGSLKRSSFKSSRRSKDDDEDEDGGD